MPDEKTSSNPAAQETTLCYPSPGATAAEGPRGMSASELFGEYELLGEIGRGGMGVVFKAREPGLNRLVAIKMVLPGAFPDDSELQRFHTEAAAAARLQ